MKIDILTLFPDMFKGFKEESIIKKAIDNKKVDINAINFRDFAKNKHKKVDDTPYGGGAGMVLMCQPIFDAVEKIKTEKSKVILLSPQGKKYDQKMAYDLSKEEHLIMICGHYEGFDERIKSICDCEISIGDYVLTGGEIPAMVLCDSITRLIPGVIEEESHLKDSFNDDLLDYPTYTKPRNYKGMEVPEVLLSGDHIDDIKNIKVKKIKEVIETGEYKLIKNDDIKAITILDAKKITGYKLKNKKSDGHVNRLLIVKPSFAKAVVLKNARKKINMLTYKFNMLLDSDDDTDSSVLGEAEMLKSFIITAYARYLGQESLDMIIKNINMIVNEFVKNKSLRNTLKSSNKEQITSRSR